MSASDAPGWSFPHQMRNYLRKIPKDVKIAAAVDRELQKEVVSLNDMLLSQDEPETKRMSTNRTGLGGLTADLIKQVKAAKDDALAAGEMLHAGISDAKSAADEIRKVARDIQREAAEAMSALGQISNGGPSD